MAWTTPTLSDLISRVTDDFVTRIQDTTARIRQSVPWTLARVLSGAVNDLYGYAAYLADQQSPLTADGEYLDRWATLYALSRESATTATGFALISGTVGQTLASGTVLVAEDGTEYETTAAVTYDGSIEAVPVAATSAGAAGNLAGNALVTLASPPSGFTAEAYTAASLGLTGGGGSTKATGYVRMQATGAATVPAGTAIEKLDGTGYTTDSDLVFDEAGYRIVGITADANGTAGNAAVGTYLEVQSPPVGVSADAIVPYDGIAGGADDEADEDLRARILDRLRTPPHGGAAADYATWARETDSVPVDNVWTFAYPDVALPNVRVYFTVDGGPIPSAGQVAAVQAYLATVKPMTATVTAYAPTANTINMSITLTVLPGYNASDVQADAAAEFDALFATHQLSAATSYVRNSKLHEAMSRVAGVDYYTFTAIDGGGGTANITNAAYELPVRGTITWS